VFATMQVKSAVFVIRSGLP